MPLNLNDWLGQTAWPWWLLVVVLVLGVAVLLRRRLLLATAVGPAAAATLAAVLPRPFWPQLLLALLVSAALTGLGALFIGCPHGAATAQPGRSDEPLADEVS